ncbi:alpha/beta-hydrolase [Penicillium malachiteum]|uniref:alpha/beta-hydrolase n=1 Tax=Penicillium malachiteum TaxID=1324776 RepID=UPI00254982B1|nr:alpha/beta-hydrolase [Penicillium malachiteum]KAJ5730115.1 alpha/beta-hydrolase [Penicillium malachiteum]
MTRIYAEDDAIPHGWQTRQPGLILWAFVSVFRVLFSSFFYAAYYIPTSCRQSPQWTYSQALRVRLLKILFGVVTELGFSQSLSLEAGPISDQWVILSPAPDGSYLGGFARGLVEPDRIGATWYPAPTPTSAELKDDSLIVLSFHSGSFLWLDGRPGDSGFVANMVNQKLGAGTRSLWVQYRLSGGKNPVTYPGPMQDAITAYHYLVKELEISPSRIILTGDSSGATIAMALIRYLASKEIINTDFADLPPPKACLLFSPSVEYSFEGDSQAVEEHRNQKTDYCGGPMAAWGARAVAPPDVVRLDDPYLSPGLHPFETPVPIFAQAGGAEVLCDTVKGFVDRMRSISGNQIEYLEVPNLPHDIYAIGRPLGWTKEQEEMIDSAVKFALKL